ncbi:MAG: hypothetical protein OXE17_02830 [Chloroflexi bacterium]|nr:hypothetical protein [Chloroflexota bacterium]
MPITGNLMMDKDKLLELVDQLRISIPQEMKAAEEMLSQKEQIMNLAMADAKRAKAKAEDEFSRQLTESEQQRRAEQLLQDAQERATRVLQMAEAEAQSRRTEADAYALRTLRSLEREINGISGSLRKGIDMLAGSTLASKAMAGNNGSAEDD